MRHHGCRGSVRTARTPRQGVETTRAPLCGPKGQAGIQDNFDATETNMNEVRNIWQTATALAGATLLSALAAESNAGVSDETHG